VSGSFEKILFGGKNETAYFLPLLLATSKKKVHATLGNIHGKIRISAIYFNRKATRLCL